MTAGHDIDFAAIADTLTRALHLQQPPVTISLYDGLPGGVPVHSGNVAAGCRFWEDAAAGAFATSPLITAAARSGSTRTICSRRRSSRRT